MFYQRHARPARARGFGIRTCCHLRRPNPRIFLPEFRPSGSTFPIIIGKLRVESLSGLSQVSIQVFCRTFGNFLQSKPVILWELCTHFGGKFILGSGFSKSPALRCAAFPRCRSSRSAAFCFSAAFAQVEREPGARRRGGFPQPPVAAARRRPPQAPVVEH